MTKYNDFSFTESRKQPQQIHPIWRGIGCILIVLIPVLSYVGATYVVRQNLKSHWFEVPAELANHVNLDFILRPLPTLRPILGGIESLYNMDLLLTLAFLIVGFGLLTVVYSMIYSAFGPSRYGPLDAPPVKRSAKRRAF